MTLSAAQWFEFATNPLCGEVKPHQRRLITKGSTFRHILYAEIAATLAVFVGRYIFKTLQFLWPLLEYCSHHYRSDLNYHQQ